MADDNGPPMSIAMVVCTIVSFLFMALRFYCKKSEGKRFHPDDYVLLLSWVLLTVSVGLSIHQTEHGLGKKGAAMDPQRVPSLIRELPVAVLFGTLSLGVSKSSFIVTLLRLVPRTWQKAWLWFMLVTINVATVASSVIAFFSCSIYGFTTSACVRTEDVQALVVFVSAYSAAMDFVLTPFPTVVLWKVQMRTREKLGVIISMSLGIIAGILGVYKSSTVPLATRDPDDIWRTAMILTWQVAEVSATIVASSIPFYRPLLRRVSSSSSRGGGGGSSSKLEGSSHAMSAVGTHSNRSLEGSGSHEHADDGHDDGHGDSNSDKNLLRISDPRIVRTTEVTVRYDGLHWSEDGAGQERQHSRREMV